MEYNRLGKAGIKVSEISFGSWLTLGVTVDVYQAKELMDLAYSSGVNFFDNAEVYANGKAEIIMGEVLKQFRRESVVVSTKILMGGEGPNDQGLSRKHLIEGTRNSLKRMQLDYVDLLYCHRPDPNTPLEETVMAMDYLINQGYALYWGTSEWSAQEIDNAYQIAKQLNCIPPTMEQPQYNLFHRQRVEQEYLPLYEKYGMGTAIWGPLAFGLLTGKYNRGIPADSRLGREPMWRSADMEQRIEKVKQLMPIAQSLDCTVAQLALAWCLKRPHVSTVIIGVSKVEQLKENLKAIEIKNQLTADIMKTIEDITVLRS